MESAWEEFERRDIGLVCIAPQKIDGMLGAKKFVEGNDFRFSILFDETRATTKAYGVYHPIGPDAFRIAHPATFLLDSNQMIQWIAVSPSQGAIPATAQIIEAIEAGGRY